MSAPILLHNGYIHSHEDPFAQAICLQDGYITWLGAEESVPGQLTAIDVQTSQDASKREVNMVDLAGAVVVPGFVDLALYQHPEAKVANTREIARFCKLLDASGVQAATVQPSGEGLESLLTATHEAYPQIVGLVFSPKEFASFEQLHQLLQQVQDAGFKFCLDYTGQELPTLEVIQQLRPDRVLIFAGNRLLGDGTASGLDAAASPDLAADPDRNQVQNPILTTWVEQLTAKVAGLELVRLLQMVHWIGQLPAQLELGKLGALRLILPPNISPTNPVANGLTVCLTAVSKDNLHLNYWQTLSKAVSPDVGWSGRGAIRGLASAGWRCVGLPDRGTLHVGAPAYLTAWSSAQVDVLAPTGGLNSWSPEAQAGSPVLPVLGQQDGDITLIWSSLA